LVVLASPHQNPVLPTSLDNIWSTSGEAPSLFAIRECCTGAEASRGIIVALALASAGGSSGVDHACSAGLSPARGRSFLRLRRVDTSERRRHTRGKRRRDGGAAARHWKPTMMTRTAQHRSPLGISTVAAASMLASGWPTTTPCADQLCADSVISLRLRSFGLGFYSHTNPEGKEDMPGG
jgi:hypothetical protein